MTRKTTKNKNYTDEFRYKTIVALCNRMDIKNPNYSQWYKRAARYLENYELQFKYRTDETDIIDKAVFEELVHDARILLQE